MITMSATTKKPAPSGNSEPAIDHTPTVKKEHVMSRMPESTDSTTAETRRTIDLPIGPCPPWCSLPAGHPWERGAGGESDRWHRTEFGAIRVESLDVLIEESGKVIPGRAEIVFPVLRSGDEIGSEALPVSMAGELGRAAAFAELTAAPTGVAAVQPIELLARAVLEAAVRRQAQAESSELADERRKDATWLAEQLEKARGEGPLPCPLWCGTFGAHPADEPHHWRIVDEHSMPWGSDSCRAVSVTLNDSGSDLGTWIELVSWELADDRLGRRAGTAKKLPATIELTPEAARHVAAKLIEAADILEAETGAAGTCGATICFEGGAAKPSGRYVTCVLGEGHDGEHKRGDQAITAILAGDSVLAVQQMLGHAASGAAPQTKVVGQG